MTGIIYQAFFHFVLQVIGARHYPSYFESCVLISQEPDAKIPYIAYVRAYRTDIHIAYSVVTKYAFRNCTSNVM